MKVFIVEDSPLVRDRLVDLVHRLSRSQIAGVAEDVAGAVRGISSTQPDVVTLDIGLGSESGLVVLRAAKQMERAPVVIVLTMYDSQFYRRRCLDEGADYFFSKTTELSRMAETLQTLETSAGIASQGAASPAAKTPVAGRAGEVQRDNDREPI